MKKEYVLPEKFVASIKEILGSEEADKLCKALEGTSPVAVRYNPYKLNEQPHGENIPWCRYGYLLNDRPQFTLDPKFHAGVYYVQEPSSMFIEQLYRTAIDDRKGLRVLDLCAAPGGKTTLLSTLVGPDGVVVANEVIRQRAMTLADNVRKWGVGNVVVTNNDPSHFEEFRDYFDVVVVDAPCSGEGMFRKDKKSRQEWSIDNVKLCAQRQRRILSSIWGALKPGGILIYSTCTFNRDENEENVEWLINNYECQSIDIEIDEQWGVVKSTVTNSQLNTRNRDLNDNSDDTDHANTTNLHETDCTANTFRLYPHLVSGEGFFAAIIQKKAGKSRVRTPKSRRSLFAELQNKSSRAVGKWFNQPEYMHFAAIGENIYAYYASAYPVVKTLSETLSVIYSGILVGQLFNNKLRPEHPLALFHDLNRDAVHSVTLNLEQALQYLRKQNIDPSQMEEGMNLLLFDGFPIGWAKRIGHRCNNLYPKELRILNL